MEILSGIAQQADRQALERCPYRNKHDACTAKFRCKNQRPSAVENGSELCGHDGPFDYQAAWETKPRLYEKAREEIAEIKRQHQKKRAGEPATEPGKTSLFDLARARGQKLASSCQQLGECHECIVEIKQGMTGLSPRSPEEGFLKGDFRLACQAMIAGDHTEIEFEPLHRSAKILTKTILRDLALKPAVVRTADGVVRQGRKLDDYRGNIFGLAIDLGTTTIAMELLDLESGEIRASASMQNPQRFGGSDVMTRISYDSSENQGELSKALINGLNREITAMCRRTKLAVSKIYEVLVVGNSTMRDMFFGLDVQGLGQNPYRSTIEDQYRAGELPDTWLNRPARGLGLRCHHRASVVGLPLIGSHVGADTAAVLAALDIDADAPEISMVVDIGTNTEIVIAGRGRMLAASCPAGPAFEGGLVKFGMPGQDGAIEHVRARSDGGFAVQTIGDVPATGICGSGLVDVLAELRRSGQMTEKGVIKKDRRPYAIPIEPDHGITFSGQDASHLAQAKAASFCGQAMLFRKFGIAPGDLSRLYLAGGFANYINIRHAIEIGFVAPVPEARIVKVGNAALQGARELLLNTDRRKALNQLVTKIEHVELETAPDFFDLFVEGCQFKPMPQDIGQI